EDRRRADAEGDAAHGTRMGRVGIAPDDHHPRLGVPLEDLGVADRLGSVVAQPQLAVQPDPLLLRERALFLLELERHVEQALLHALGRHRFAEEGEVIAEHEDRAWVVHLLVRSHELLEEDRRHGGDVLVGPDEKVHDPGSILMFRDHLTFLGEAMTPERVKEGLLDVALELEKKQRAFAEKQGIRLYGELRLGHHGSEAICHSKILEGHAEPGMVIIGSDSHTPHAGAVGCVAFGVGTTAIFNSWITKDVRLTVPETVKVVVRGRKPDNVTAKDFMLEILRHPYVKS